MRPALLTRLRPSGPWRYGPADGAPDRVDTLFRSDRLYSAMTLAMQRLGWLEEWLAATAQSNDPAIAFSSLFPFQGDTLFATPPASAWPPAASQVTAPNPVFLAKLRWRAAHFVPLTVLDSLLTGGRLLAEQWLPDPESGCLLRRDRPNASPFRVALRHGAAVDRINRTSQAGVTAACVEFESGAGLWCVTRYKDKAVEAAWNERLQGAFRLLADSGFGGRRSSGWGQASAPEFQRGAWPALILPKLARIDPKAGDQENETQTEPRRYWLLSLYSPATGDRVDWSGGDYQVTMREGRMENGNGGGEKKILRMIAEGSVLQAADEPNGAAVDVAPDGFRHPVYRSGLALALELPRIIAATFSEAQAAEVPPEMLDETPASVETCGAAEPKDENVAGEEDRAAETSTSYQQPGESEGPTDASAHETEAGEPAEPGGDDPQPPEPAAPEAESGSTAEQVPAEQVPAEQESGKESVEDPAHTPDDPDHPADEARRSDTETNGAL